MHFTDASSRAQGRVDKDGEWLWRGKQKMEHIHYTSCLCVCFSLCPKGLFDPDPLSLLPCSCEKLNPQPSILMPNLSIQRAAHAYSQLQHKAHCKAIVYLLVCLPDYDGSSPMLRAGPFVSFYSIFFLNAEKHFPRTLSSW